MFQNCILLQSVKYTFSISVYKELLVIRILVIVVTEGEGKFDVTSVDVKLTLSCQIFSLTLQFFGALWVMRQNNEFLFSPVNCSSSSITK